MWRVVRARELGEKVGDMSTLDCLHGTKINGNF